MRMSPFHSPACLLWVLLAAVVLVGCGPEAKKARHLRKATAHFEAGDYGKAEIEFAQYQRLAGKEMIEEVAERLAVVYWEQGRLLSARLLLGEALSKFSNNVPLRLTWGKLALADGAGELAQGEFRYVLSKDPRSGDAMRLLAQSAVTAEEVARVGQELAALRAQVGDVSSLHVALGFLELRSRRVEQAEAEFRRALELNAGDVEAMGALAGIALSRGDSAQAGKFLAAAAEKGSPHSGKRLEYGLFLLRSGETERGREVLEKLTKEVPDYLPAWKALATLQLAEGKTDLADGALQRVLAVEALDYEALRLRGRLEVARQRPAQALEALTLLARVYTNSPGALVELGTAHLALGQLTEATESFRRAVRMNTNYLEAQLLLARMHIQLGRAEQALGPLRELCRRRPPIGEAFQLLTEAHVARNESEAALAVARQHSELDPKAFEPVFDAGRILLNLRRKDEGRATLEKALEMRPGDAFVMEYLVNLDLVDREYERALRRLAPMAGGGTNVPALLLQGRVYFAQTNYAAAERVLERAVELEPGARGAYMMLANIQVLNQRHPQALTNLQAVVTRSTNDWAAYLRMASIHYTLKDYRAAAAAFEDVLRANPRHGPAMNDLAMLYAERLDRVDRALELAQGARTLLPRSPAVADTLGWVWCLKGEYVKGLPLLREAAARSSSDPEVLYHLGMAHYMMVDPMAARSVLERALAAPGEFAWKEPVQKRLLLVQTATEQLQVESVEASIDRTEGLPGQPAVDPMALFRRAELAEAAGDWAKARTLYEKVAAVSPFSIGPNLRLASLLATRLNEPAKAFDVARQTRERAPGDPQAAFLAGQIASLAGNHRWAVGTLLEAARDIPNDPAVLWELAKARYAIGQVAEALGTARQALQVDASFSGAEEARLLVEYLGLAGNPEQAGAAAGQVQKTLESRPDYVPALMVAGSIYEQRGNLGDARLCFEKALGVYPQFAPAMKRLAFVYAKTGSEDAKALEMAAKAREALAGDVELAALLGGLAHRTGDYRRAAVVLAEVVARQPSDVQSLYLLGLSQARLKQIPESRRNLGTALRQAPNHALAEEARKALEDKP